MAQVTKSDYETAQKGDAKVRQDFLGAVDLEEARDFVKDIFYCSSSSDSTNSDSFIAMSCNSPMSHFFKIPFTLGRSNLVVYPESFAFSYPQFINSLIKHEGQHARQAMYHPYFYAKIHYLIEEGRKQDSGLFCKYLGALREVPALANELISSDKFDFIDTERSNISIRLAMGLVNLHSYSERDLKKDFRKIMCDTQGDYFAEKLVFEKYSHIFSLAG